MYELASRAFDKPNAFNTGNGTAGGNNTGQFDQEEFYRNFSKVGQITLQQILVKPMVRMKLIPGRPVSGDLLSGRLAGHHLRSGGSTFIEAHDSL